ncbi:acyltransferase family protein [Microbulbifer hainanensis]|uniref:acyltransferase family protein n=1 Tax=Microbulbifer hainanensis TaxID=2735675 RepID=UPI0018664499|nr:acyltransferase [Microbulbifer hainanensis]
MQSAPNRNALIDTLRGVAILLVLLLHHALSYGFKGSVVSEWMPVWLLRALVFNGNYGVTIFFTVSGYLITSMALRRYGTLERIDWLHFYCLRAARILPPLLLALAVITLLALCGFDSFRNTGGGNNLGDGYLALALFSVVTFWHNVLMQSLGYFNYALNVYWSLSVEEVFYLCFPLACLLLRRQWSLAVLCLALVMVGPWYRAQHADNEIYFMYGYLACFDAIALGCLAAMVQPLVRAGHWRYLRYIALLLLPAIYLRGIYGHQVWGFTLVSLCTAVSLIHAPSVLPAAFQQLTRPLRWMGRHSYELYLFHIIVLGLLRNIISPELIEGNAKLIMLLVMVSLSCLLSHLVAHWYSAPLNRLIRSLRAPRRGPAVAVL